MCNYLKLEKRNANYYNKKSAFIQGAFAGIAGIGLLL
jgi:hypothetical protein